MQVLTAMALEWWVGIGFLAAAMVLLQRRVAARRNYHNHRLRVWTLRLRGRQAELQGHKHSDALTALDHRLRDQLLSISHSISRTLQTTLHQTAQPTSARRTNPPKSSRNHPP